MPDLRCIEANNSTGLLSEDALVSELIDEDTKHWNRGLIFLCFERNVAQQIINTPLSFRLPPDELVWNWEKDGEYSVRSAYHLLCDEKARLQPGPSIPHKSKLWKEIWRAPIPSKIRNFMWRLAKNILPTRENIHKKGITLDLQCPLCHRDEESAHHLFLKCDMFKLSLFSSHLGSHIPMGVDLHDWLLKWLTCQDPLGAQFFYTLLWKFWTGRNEVVFKGLPLDPARVAEAAMNFVHEFNAANPKRPRSTIVSEALLQPTNNSPMFSMFVDAGCGAGGPTGWGLTMHNQAGETVPSMCKKENIDVAPLLAEALGVRWALQVVRDQGITSVIIHSDAAHVVNCINKKTSFAAINMICQDCSVLMTSLSNVCIQYVSRALNADAHNLASLAKDVGNRTWLGVAPTFSVCNANPNVSVDLCNHNSCVPACF